MSNEYSGKGDPRRSIELLWGTAKSATRGPKPGTSVANIVQAAIEIADAEGLAALSMRGVAERLKIGAMSLYTYVPGKAELLDLMLDRVYGEIQLSGSTADGWRVGLERRALEDWAMYRRHPWVLQIAAARPLLGPNETAVFESSARTVSGIGLHAGEMVAVVDLVVRYVRGAAHGALEAALAKQQTGESDDSWWAAREPLFDAVFDPQRFPTLVGLSRAGAFDPVPGGDTDYLLQQALDNFTFGLQRVLDGIDAFVRQHAHGNEQ